MYTARPASRAPDSDTALAGIKFHRNKLKLRSVRGCMFTPMSRLQQALHFSFGVRWSRTP